ncbi:MAG: hypothetical protein AAFU54_11530 [Chloroflexota bacterium]
MQRKTQKIVFALVVLSLMVVMAIPLNAQAGQIRLDNNRGLDNDVWRIEGERTVVLNGFDLTPTSLQLPVVIESVTIQVESPVPNGLADAVVYQDPNGGSPADAQLVGLQQVSITQPGVFVAQFQEPVIVTAPVVWVGFNLPVGLEFLADTQGSSVLTYWAWSPGTTFNLLSLSNATILGPSDGSDPVNLDIGGVARITAFARSANVPADTSPSLLNSEGFVEDADRAAAFLSNYNNCSGLFFDNGDIDITYQSAIGGSCTEQEIWRAPIAPAGFNLRGRDGFTIYDVTFFDDEGDVISGPLLLPVTHCLAPPEGVREQAVIGVAYGTPRRWDLLETQVFGNLACAEIPRGGNIGYLTPN